MLRVGIYSWEAFLKLVLPRREVFSGVFICLANVFEISNNFFTVDYKNATVVFFYQFILMVNKVLKFFFQHTINSFRQNKYKNNARH